MARRVALNAKMRRTGICGATETILVDRACAATHLRPLVADLLEAGCEVRGDTATQDCDRRVVAATDGDWGKEFLDAIVAVRVVAGLDEALAHIRRYGSAHTEAIITEDGAAAQRFLSELDSAILMHNTSTQFADGGEFGMGAEIGIATGKSMRADRSARPSSRATNTSCEATVRSAPEAARMQAEQHRFDLIVIGAGINGAAIAREAALCGLKPLLLDRGDIGSGTSSASSRLIHGGLRYLEHLELKLVHESLAERERLLTCAPHLVQPLELVIPLYRGGRRKPWQIRLGLQLYDWLSGRQELPSHRSLSREELLELMPGLRRDGLVAGASYFDAQVAYPERMIVELVRDAVANGAKLVTYARVTRIASERGAVTGCEWQARERRASVRRAQPSS